jgi:gas vesicle protein GvpN
VTTVLQARPRRFVSTPSVERVATRALRYLQSGFSVHLRGPAGTGKTTLALHLADLLSRPIMLIFGDDEFKTSDLIGNQAGYTRKKVVDNYIHSVVKVEDELRQNWVDSRLTLACREGFTLVYDEFNRSRPEVNNVLLSALEEKLLVLPPSGNRNEYIRVNLHFRAIFTSNPEEYCGVHDTQDALLDRLVTINMPEPDELTQQEIVVQKTGIDRESAAIIVSLVKAFRIKVGAEKTSGLRSCLMVGKVCHEHEILVMPENPEFRDVCQDVLLSRTGRSLTESTQLLWELFNELICPELDPADLLEDCDLSQPETLIFNPQAQTHPEAEVLSGELSKQTSSPNIRQDANLEIAELPAPASSKEGVPFEWEVYEYLQEFQGARISQIETALGINRYEVVTALRSLTEQGIQFNPSIAETISAYRIHITSEDEA